MKLLVIFGVVLFLSSSLIIASSSPGIEYGLGKSKSGNAIISNENAFHGPHSVMLSVGESKKYIRLMIYLEDPLPLEEVDDFCMQLLPRSGAGDIEIRFFLDVNGDGKYTSKVSDGDNWIKSRANIWDGANSSESVWSELSAFDSRFVYKNRTGDEIGDLAGCQDHFGIAGVVRIWITMYGMGEDGGSCRQRAECDVISDTPYPQPPLFTLH